MANSLWVNAGPLRQAYEEGSWKGCSVLLLFWWGRGKMGHSGFLEQITLGRPLMEREGTWAKTARAIERKGHCPQHGDPEPGGKQMAWLRADTGLGLGEKKHLPGCSLQGGGSTARSRGSSAAPKGTWAPIPFICGHKGTNPKSTSPLPSCPE